jgi:hypothetical protein
VQALWRASQHSSLRDGSEGLHLLRKLPEGFEQAQEVNFFCLMM